MIESPLNYTGGKFKLLPDLIKYFPKKINCFVDLFCGGCNVGINVEAESIIFNDSNKQLINLYETLKNNNLDYTFESLNKLIEKYNLSNVSSHGYEFYNCNSSKGLASYNKEKFNQLKTDFNSLTSKDDLYNYMLYLLIVYSFNNQIRFNSKGEFNLPVGKRDFNKKMQNKLLTFTKALKDKNISFLSTDFNNLDLNKLNENDFVYADPPYLITCASYNENGGWSEEKELELLNLLDKLNEKNIKFALSNVLENKGKSNVILKQWIENNPKYKVIHLNKSYSNSNYHGLKNSFTDEVLIINYKN